jgi:FMN phosphatase YigB (HAD superfamily)
MKVILVVRDLNRKLTADFGEEYKFFDYFKINDELLEIYKELRQKFPIYIFTTDSIQNKVEVSQIISPIVTQIYSANLLGLDKKNSESYSTIAKKIMKPTQEILYIDDTVAN